MGHNPRCEVILRRKELAPNHLASAGIYGGERELWLISVFLGHRHGSHCDPAIGSVKAQAHALHGIPAVANEGNFIQYCGISILRNEMNLHDKSLATKDQEHGVVLIVLHAAFVAGHKHSACLVSAIHTHEAVQKSLARSSVFQQ